MTEQTANTSVPTPASAPHSGESPLKILHISDIHLGFRFQRSNWRQLVAKALELQPDLVLISGDLVNTPWRWMLRRARTALDELSNKLVNPQHKGPCPVWVVAGNHDTRITGLVPVGWLWWISVLAAGLALGSWATANALSLGPAWLRWVALLWSAVFSAIALTGVLLRLLVSSDLAGIWGEHLLTSATVTDDQRVGILPIDSATYGVSMARGYVASSQFADHGEQMRAATAALPAGSRSPAWIAMVHHHLLPLPYDSDHERMMVMDNAGALVSELSRHGVRLALHGHKHHQHFARIVVDSARSPGAEMAVLSAGTPTEARNAGAFWHGFNMIEVDGTGHIEIKMFQGPPGGGKFQLERTFDLVAAETQDKWRFENDAQYFGLRCRRMVCHTEISSAGDARFFREYSSVSTTLPRTNGFQGELSAAAQSGLMEAYVARSLSSHGPRVSVVPVDPAATDPSRIAVRLNFEGAGLQCDDEPIDFFTEVYGNNAFALNRWQFDSMYPGRTDGTEDVRYRIPEGLAIEELVLQVRFPPEVGVPQRVQLRVRPSGAPEGAWRWLPTETLIRLSVQDTVHVRIPYPAPGSLYQINWDLKENNYGDGNRDRERGIERALGLREWLGSLRPENVPRAVADLLLAVEKEARNAVGADSKKVLQCALFVFPPDCRVLRYLIGNHEDGDPRRHAEYRYGLGLPGRALKLAAPVGFRRPPYTTGERPWGYVMPNGDRVSAGSRVPEVAILAIPLAPPQATDWPYAVLQFSTDDPTCTLKTTDIASDTSIESYKRVLAEFMTLELEKVYH